MASYYLYVYSPDDFIGGLPDEYNGSALGTPFFALTLKPGATPTLIEVDDDDGWLDETGDSQTLVNDVDIDGETYTAGTRVHSAYDLINTGTGLKVTSLHFGGDGFQQGAVQGLASTAPLQPGQTYFFNYERSSYLQDNQYSDYVACFAKGTRITTTCGERPVEDLRIGDFVMTQDHGPQPLTWIARRTVLATGAFAPVVFPTGALGNTRPLVLSPQHRVVIREAQAELLFGEREVMVPALYFAEQGLAYRRNGGEVTYFHLMFDRHQLIYSEGIATESFLPGERLGLSAAAWEEFRTLFPELAANHAQGYGAARRVLRRHETALLLAS